MWGREAVKWEGCSGMRAKGSEARLETGASKGVPEIAG